MCCGYEEVAPTLEVTLERKTFKALGPARMLVHLGDKRIQRYESSLLQGPSSVFDGWHFVFRDVLAFALGPRGEIYRSIVEASKFLSIGTSQTHARITSP